MTALNNEILGDALITAGKRIRAGKCILTYEQADHIMSELMQAVDVEVSKEEACAILGISRSTFDARVAAGEIPPGKHVRGFKELRWDRRKLTDGPGI